MRGTGLVVLAAVLVGGCTSVKMVQRDGCWVRQTKRTLGGAKEDLGPCTRPEPRWSDDRLTRLVQECVAQADYRWRGRALAAWSRNQPLPPQPSQETVIDTCLSQTATGAVAQSELQAQALRERLADVSSDREALRRQADAGDEHLRETSTKLAEYLGEAAKRPPPVATATATATSDGTATTESGLESQTGSTSQTLPAAAPIVPASAPAAAPVGARPGAPAPRADACAPAPATKGSRLARAGKRPRPARQVGCEIPSPSAAAPAGAPAPAAPAEGELAARPAAGDAPAAAGGAVR